MVLIKEDNELITDVQRGTLMGEVFLCFWVPLLLADELPVPDGEPVRVRILNEDLTNLE